jgi:hypothetical protein
MKPIRFLIAAAILLVPIAVRTLWFYQGTYQRSSAPPVPDYAAIQVAPPVLSTPIVDPPVKTKNPAVVLVDMAHSNFYTLSEIEPLTHYIKSTGSQLDILEGSMNLADQLKDADSFVVIAPATAYTPEELQAVSKFVQRGGRLLVVTDPTRSLASFAAQGGGSLGGGSLSSTALSSVDIANMILAPYDTAFNDDYAYNLINNANNFRNIIVNKIAQNPLTTHISKLVFYSAHTLKTGQTALLTGDNSTYSSLTDTGNGLALAAVAQNGQVMAIGDVTFMTTPYDQVDDNGQLVNNIGQFLVSGVRTTDLADFPYLFKHPVTLLTTEGVKRDNSLVEVMSEAQKALAKQGIQIQLGDKPADGNDLLVLGAFPPGKDLQPYLEPFKVVYSKEPPADSTGTVELAPTPTPTATLESASATPAPAVIPDKNTPTPESSPFGMLPSTFGSDSKAVTGSITLPGYGQLPVDGVGLILFTPAQNRNTLVLVAPDDSGLSTLAGLLTSGDLSGCTTQGEVSVCKLNSSSSFK